MSTPNDDQQGGRGKKPIPSLAASKRDSKRYHAEEQPKRAPSFLGMFRDEAPAEEAEAGDYEMDVNAEARASSGQRYVERNLANLESQLGISGNLQYQSASDDDKSALTTDTELLRRIPPKIPLDEENSGTFPRSHEPSVASDNATGKASALVMSSGMEAPPKAVYGSAPVGEIAVAREVHEDYFQSDGICRPSAKEYDPTTKNERPSIRRRLPTFLAAFCCCGVIVGGVVGGLFAYQASTGGGGSNSASDMEPSSPPTTTSEGVFMDQLAKIAGTDIYIPNSPQNRAARWLMYEDPLALSVTDPTLWQRYTLALFYISTIGSNVWRSCNAPSRASQGSDCMFDELFRQTDDTLAYHEIPSTRWLSEKPECEWAGILCDEDQVHGIELPGQNITGTLPVGLSSLPYIQTISLHYNAFTGTIPVEYATTRNIINLDLHGNQLTGSIPTELYAKSSLQQVNLGENKLTGTISPLVGQLTSLKGFHVGHNLLEGSIPSEIGNLDFLTHTRWDHNRFTGKLPDHVQLLISVQEFWVQSNRLSGVIPSELGSMVELVDLQLYENQFTGTIPEEIYDLKNLLRLELSDNALTGTISTRIGLLRLLTDFRVRRNKLTGTIPLQLGSLNALRIMWLHMNLLEGAVPENVCNNVGPGFLEFLNADCGPEENPATPCACCTGCCDRVTEICLLTANAAET